MKKTNNCKLQFESLEDRRVFAITVLYDPVADLLRVRGTSGADRVEIRENHASSRTEVFDNDIRVFSRAASEVRQISVRLFEGNDTCNYSLTADLARNRTVGINLGSGTNQLDFNGNNQDIRADLFFNVLGGTGRDVVRCLDVGDIQGVKAEFKFDLGRGNDNLGFRQEGDLRGDAELIVTALGGNDTDGLTFFAAENDDIDVSDDATLSVLLDGGNGVDTLGFYYAGENDGQFQAVLHGGNGYDFFRLYKNPDEDSDNEPLVTLTWLQEELPAQL